MERIHCSQQASISWSAALRQPFDQTAAGPFAAPHAAGAGAEGTLRSSKPCMLPG